MNKYTIIFITAMAAAALTGCSSGASYPDVAGNVRQSLKANGLSEVSVSQNREKGVVTLTGNVPSEQDKAKAESLAKNDSGSEVVADEIAVTPPNTSAKKVNSEMDHGIEDNLKAAFTKDRVDRHVNYSVKNEVVTLTGNVRTRTERREADEAAKSVANVQQVVNEINVRDQPATDSH